MALKHNSKKSDFKLIRLSRLTEKRSVPRGGLSPFMLARYVSSRDQLTLREVKHVESYISGDASVRQQYEKLRESQVSGVA
jgi:hypothetical protein